MKKCIIFIMLLALASIVYAEGGLNLNDTVEGTEGVSFSVTSTGGWDAVDVPSTVAYTRHLIIQVHDGSGTVSDLTEGFLWSFDSDGNDYQYAESLAIPIGKTAGDTILYIKASAVSKIISVAVLK